MKRIVIMNCITISLIVILSYISTPDNQIIANHYLLYGFGSVIAFMTFLWIVSLLVKDASIVDIFLGTCIYSSWFFTSYINGSSLF